MAFPSSGGAESFEPIDRIAKSLRLSRVAPTAKKDLTDLWVSWVGWLDS